MFNVIIASESERDPPTTLLWTYHYLAQHYDLLGDTERALDFVNKAVDHTITMIEAYIIKARIFKVSSLKYHCSNYSLYKILHHIKCTYYQLKYSPCKLYTI